MKHLLPTVGGLTATAFTAALIAVQPAAAAALAPSILHVGQIAHQDIRPAPGSEPDTLVEPSIAVSPIDTNVAVAAAHDGRFAGGGAVDISYSWTQDGGASWHHRPLHGLTKADGGTWDRASDPVVAFGPDGEVYISALVIDISCASGVAVARSTDDGATFGAPMLVHSSATCNYSDDKDWLVADTQPASPHRGRLYQFWTAFLTVNGHPAGSPQVLRWSDDHGLHWSRTVVVSDPHENTQNSQPMIQPDGSITDAYLGRGNSSMVARTSHDGGATWSGESKVTNSVGFGPAGIRCCLPSAAADPVTGELYAVWEANGPGRHDPVELSSSSDGRHWSAARTVSRGGSSTIQYITAVVTAYGGRVFVAFGARDTAVDSGNLIQQELASSYDGGVTFGPPLPIGPVSNLRWAAVSGGKFPGDYAGASAARNRVLIAWCASSRPANPLQKYHQTLFAAVLRP